MKSGDKVLNGSLKLAGLWDHGRGVMVTLALAMAVACDNNIGE